MSLKQQIENDLKEAMKARDSIRVSCLRLIKAAVKNKEVELKGELDDGKVVGVLSTLAKQRNESIEQYHLGGRPELAEKEAEELKWIQSYLPRALTEEEIRKHIEDAVQETGAKGPADMGKVMKALVPKTTGRVDGKTLSQRVKTKLSGV